MAELRINEFRGIGQANFKVIHAPVAPPLALQTVTIGATSAAASATNADAGLIELYAEADCHVNFAGVDATTSDYFMAAGERLPFILGPGTVIKVKDTS